MMSGSTVGRCASIVSLAPPPVAPTRSAPPGLILPVLGAEPLAAELVLLLPPHAASRPPAPITAPVATAPRRTWRRVKLSWNGPSV